MQLLAVATAHDGRPAGRPDDGDLKVSIVFFIKKMRLYYRVLLNSCNSGEVNNVTSSTKRS